MPAATSSSARMNDPVRVDSTHYGVEYEDERVRVLRARYAPGEKSVMHGHPALVAIMLTNGTMRMTYPDGTEEIMSVVAGQVMPAPAMEHLPENIGDQELRVILVELKG